MSTPKWKSVACALALTALAAPAGAEDDVTVESDVAEETDVAATETPSTETGEGTGEGTGVGNGAAEAPPSGQSGSGEGTGIGNGAAENLSGKPQKCRVFKAQNPGSADAQGLIDQFAEEMGFDELRDGQSVTVDTRVTYTSEQSEGRTSTVQSRQEIHAELCTELEGEGTVQETAVSVATRTEETSAAEAGTSDEGERDVSSSSTLIAL